MYLVTAPQKLYTEGNSDSVMDKNENKTEHKI